MAETAKKPSNKKTTVALEGTNDGITWILIDPGEFPVKAGIDGKRFFREHPTAATLKRYRVIRILDDFPVTVEQTPTLKFT